MVKKTQTVIKYLIYLYLLIFPLGKLLKTTIYNYQIDASDFIVLLIAILTPVASLKINKIPNWLKAIISFLAWSFFSLIVTNITYAIGWQKLSLFYITRLSSYLLLPWAVYISINKKDKQNLTQLMLVGTVFISIIGWLQYTFYPDLRQLKVFGWDDHLNRLVSTFLDPAFTGIFLVFGLILGNFIFKNKKLKFGYLSLIFISLLFTYSRASYLSLIVVTFFAMLKKSKKTLIGLIFAFIFVIFILPRPGGSGAELERVHSIFSKFQNYEQSVQLINKSPLIGFGFNNLCFVKNENLLSHSCSGLDNSFLFVVATTGLVGLLFYLEIGRQLLLSTVKNIYGQIFLLSTVSLLVHTLFTNTLFYNFVLGWMGILVGISRSTNQNK